MPKAKPDQVIVHRIELQEKEREALKYVLRERQAVNAGKAALVVVGGYLAVNALTSTWKIVNGIVEAPRAMYDKLGESILGETNYNKLKEENEEKLRQSGKDPDNLSFGDTVQISAEFMAGLVGYGWLWGKKDDDN